MTLTIELFPLNKQSPYVMDAVKIYNEYLPGDMTYQEHFFRSNMHRPGYVGLVAKVNHTIAGVAFGSYSLAGQWWHERVATHVGREHPVLQNAWVLTQLNVLKAYRNHKIGSLLLDRITELQDCQRLLLSTQVANTAAQRFYLRHGWQILHQGFNFSAGDEPYKILHKSLR